MNGKHQVFILELNRDTLFLCIAAPKSLVTCSESFLSESNSNTPHFLTGKIYPERRLFKSINFQPSFLPQKAVLGLKKAVKVTCYNFVT